MSEIIEAPLEDEKEVENDSGPPNILKATSNFKTPVNYSRHRCF